MVEDLVRLVRNCSRNGANWKEKPMFIQEEGKNYCFCSLIPIDSNVDCPYLNKEVKFDCKHVHMYACNYEIQKN